MLRNHKTDSINDIRQIEKQILVSWASPRMLTYLIFSSCGNINISLIIISSLLYLFRRAAALYRLTNIKIQFMIYTIYILYKHGMVKIREN